MYAVVLYTNNCENKDVHFVGLCPTLDHGKLMAYNALFSRVYEDHYIDRPLNVDEKSSAEKYEYITCVFSTTYIACAYRVDPKPENDLSVQEAVDVLRNVREMVERPIKPITPIHMQHSVRLTMV